MAVAMQVERVWKRVNCNDFLRPLVRKEVAVTLTGEGGLKGFGFRVDVVVPRHGPSLRVNRQSKCGKLKIGDLILRVNEHNCRRWVRGRFLKYVKEHNKLDLVVQRMEPTALEEQEALERIIAFLDLAGVNRVKQGAPGPNTFVLSKSDRLRLQRLAFEDKRYEPLVSLMQVAIKLKHVQGPLFKPAFAKPSVFLVLQDTEPEFEGDQEVVFWPKPDQVTPGCLEFLRQVEEEEGTW